jgi:hypothetical protein
LSRHELNPDHVANKQKLIAQTTVTQTQQELKRKADIKKIHVLAAIHSAFRHVYFLTTNRLANVLLQPLRVFSIREGNTHFDALTKKNAQYASSTFFHNAVHAIGDVMLNDTVKQLSLVRYFSVMIDGTVDISVTELMGVFVRYYDRLKKEVVTVFFDMVALKQTTGEAIFDALMKCFEDKGVDTAKLCGFASDGASNQLGNCNRCLRVLTLFQARRKAVHHA